MMAAGKEITKYYFGENGPGPDKYDDIIKDATSDAMFIAPGMLTTTSLAKKLQSPIYEYLYSHHGSVTFYNFVTMKPYQFLLKVRACTLK